MSAAHTPGPWVVLDDGFGTAKKIHPDISGPSLATVHSYSTGHGPVDAERDANARLIAAAPDLLDALQWAVSSQPQDDSFENWVSDARAAILKATA